MLQVIKKNILLIISFSILLSLLCFDSYKYIDNRKNIDAKTEEAKIFCLSNDYINTDYEEYCNKTLNNEHFDIDFFTVYTNIAVFGIGRLSFILFLFIIMPSLYNICKYMKNRQIINDSTRMNYKNSKFKIFIEAYKSSFILPSIIFIAFVICYCYVGNFNPEYAIENSTSVWSETTLNNPYLFLLTYLLNIIVHSILYINIALCIARKYNNYFVAVILSFLTFIGIESILEIGFNGILFTTILSSDSGIIFNIMNMITFNDSCGILALLSIPTSVMLISFIVLHFMYKEKEILIIDCEKNE